ncbi:MAG: hypothetical protein OEY89_17500 [Gammaproteobacteria bacterium]|nr:hypothetical protein [Gammaproteobacteria bacterium]
MKKGLIVTLGIGLMLLAGCSSVKFYDSLVSDSDESGFLYYPPKPYVLIEQGEKTVTTKLISIPDLSRPHRVKHSVGFGAVEMGFEIENGMIKSFNSKSDSKGPEAITALAGIGTAKAALITAEAEMATATKELQPSADKMGLLATENKYDVVIIIDITKELKANVIDVLSSAPTARIFSRELSILNSQATNLGQLSSIKYNTTKPDELISKLEEYRKSSVKVINELSGVNSTLEIYSSNPKVYPNDFSYAMNAKQNLADLIKKLKGFSSRSSSIVGLYEIEFIDGSLKLKKVTFE